MTRRWLKPCPRCRGNHLLETRDDARRAVRCTHCGYLLLLDEIRFLVEDTVLEYEHAQTAA